MLVELSHTSNRTFDYERNPAWLQKLPGDTTIGEFFIYEVKPAGRETIAPSQYRKIARVLRDEWNAVIMKHDAIYLEKENLMTWLADRKNLPAHLTHLTTYDMHSLLLQFKKILDDLYREQFQLKHFSKALGFSIEASPSPPPASP